MTPPNEPIPIRVEYGEEHLPEGEELELYAATALHVKILDVTQVGPDLRYRYAILWENGETAPTSDEEDHGGE